MFCKQCGMKVENDARFCSSCGAKLKGAAPVNTVVKTVTKTIGGRVFGGNINQNDIAEANAYLKANNFGKVFWNFNMVPGLVKGITFTGEIMDKPLPYYFQVDVKYPPGATKFGAWSTMLSGWNADDALNEWISQNPHKRMRASRVITHGGIPTQLYILYTIKK